MKHHLVSATALAALLALGAGAHSRAQTSAPFALELATPQSESFALGPIAGRPLRGINHEELGNLTDFLADAKTGHVEFAIAPSGRGPAGETFRLVPMTEIDASRGTEAFRLNLTRDQWNQVGTMTEGELRGMVSLNPEQQQRLARQFGMNTGARGFDNLVRASTLKGRELRSGNDALGTIDDVAIDFQSRTAAPLLRTSAVLAGSGQKVLVPFDRLQLTDGQGALATTLTRADFQRLQPGVSPTGYNSAAFGRGMPPAQAAAMAVQQALARDQAASGVQVVPESRLVLRGTVDNDQKRVEIERAANQAAPGMRIDNQITVRGW